jgi:hypothetical protein
MFAADWRARIAQTQIFRCESESRCGKIQDAYGISRALRRRDRCHSSRIFHRLIRFIERITL